MPLPVYQQKGGWPNQLEKQLETGQLEKQLETGYVHSRPREAETVRKRQETEGGLLTTRTGGFAKDKGGVW